MEIYFCLFTIVLILRLVLPRAKLKLVFLYSAGKQKHYGLFVSKLSICP